MSFGKPELVFGIHLFNGRKNNKSKLRGGEIDDQREGQGDSKDPP